MTANPNTPLHRIPSSPVGAKLPAPDGMPTSALQPPLQDTGYTGFHLWLHRITVLLFVFFCASLGVLLLIMPWRPEWTDNRLLLGNPALRGFVSHGFVRGFCSGLGVLDIWIGFWEAVHYHEKKRA